MNLEAVRSAGDVTGFTGELAHLVGGCSGEAKPLGRWRTGRRSCAPGVGVGCGVIAQGCPL